MEKNNSNPKIQTRFPTLRIMKSSLVGSINPLCLVIVFGTQVLGRPATTPLPGSTQGPGFGPSQANVDKIGPNQSNHQVTDHQSQSNHQVTSSTVNATVTTASTTAHPIKCRSFVCLLDKFEVLKTDDGFILRRLDRPAKSGCKGFACWMRQFKVQKLSYGFQLQLRNQQTTPRAIVTTTTTVAPTTEPLLAGDYSWMGSVNYDTSDDYFNFEQSESLLLGLLKKTSQSQSGSLTQANALADIDFNIDSGFGDYPIFNEQSSERQNSISSDPSPSQGTVPPPSATNVRLQ